MCVLREGGWVRPTRDTPANETGSQPYLNAVDYTAVSSIIMEATRRWVWYFHFFFHTKMKHFWQPSPLPPPPPPPPSIAHVSQPVSAFVSGSGEVYGGGDESDAGDETVGEDLGSGATRGALEAVGRQRREACWVTVTMEHQSEGTGRGRPVLRSLRVGGVQVVGGVARRQENVTVVLCLVGVGGG